MAIGKARSSKRSSGSFCSSTITTITFIALCIMGAYMLTTNSVVFPQTATRTTPTTATKTSARLSSIIHIAKRKQIEGKEFQAYDDNQGNLPDDAIKSDDPGRAGENQNSQDASEKVVTDSASVRSSSMAANEAENNLNDKQEVEKENSIDRSSIDDRKESEKDSNGFQSHQGDAQVDNPESNQRQVSYEDQRQRSEHQRQEEELMQQEGKSQEETQGVTSEDQIQHDEASISSNEPQNTPETTKESKTKTGNQENQVMYNEGENDQKTSSQVLNQNQQLPKENSGDSIPGGEGSGIPTESKESKNSWKTQAGESKNEKERQKDKPNDQHISTDGKKWQLCNVTAGPDYIPCLDNEKAIAKLPSRQHYQHRERHCPEEAPTCLVPLPKGYKTRVEWPQSRDKIWYHNVPNTKLAEVKGHQNWVKVSGEFLTFPGGGTQFIHGALHYLDFIQEAMPDIAWGKHTRVVLDVGCGVASFGGYLFDRDVLTMSLAPKDEHEAQVQFALERGIPAISAVMGTQRLPFPSKVFDLVHCARCRVPWHVEGGALLLELNRVLRPGGYFVWSATPVYQKLEEDVQIWKEMSALTMAICWELVTIKKDKLNSIGAAIYRKPRSNKCYEHRKSKEPPLCKGDDDPNAAWYVPLQSCMHRIPTEENERSSKWPAEWPNRLQTSPYWLNRTQKGIYGKPAPDDFAADYELWKQILSKSYLNGLGISWSNVRNVMDMRAAYGGFAAVLKELKLWVMNVVNIDSPDTLPIIYERGLFGIYHDWCESFSTYPRTYDLLHADHLFSNLKKRCKLAPVIVEVDRILRPGGKLIVRDESSTIGEVENLLRSLHWEVRMTFSMNQEGMLSAQKTEWRPDSYASSS